MSMEIILTMSAVSVLSALFFAMRIFSWRDIVRYHYFADIAFTGTLVYLFNGTLGGMLVAALGGLLFSIILSIGRFVTPGIRNQVEPTEEAEAA